MERETKVVVLPFVAFGHMIPFYHLSLALAKSGITVHYVSTPNNIARLPAPPPSVAHLINLVKIPLPVVDTCPLPIGAEATVDVPPEMVPQLTMAYDLLQHPFKELVATLSPDWLIIDFLPYWAVQIGRDLGVPILTFSAFSATTKLFFGPPEYLVGDGQKRVRSTVESLMSPPPWVNFPSSVAFRQFEAVGVVNGFYGGMAERIAKTLDGSEAMAIRSCKELEGESLHLFSKLLGKPVIPTGLLTPEPSDHKKITDEYWVKTFQWLDTQKEKSVLFIGFGSECKLRKEEIQEIAHGIELSELPFLWAIRKPIWATEETDIFPQNFISKMSNRGKICIGWAPQMEILGHPSIGVSLFHSGWGSVIETLQFGLRLVLLPLIIDQGLNARFLVEKGLAIEVEREEDGSFSGKEIAEALRRAMTGDEGMRMETRLKEAVTIVSDRKLQELYMNEFVKYLKNWVPNPK